jgi:hypothetical protein
MPGSNPSWDAGMVQIPAGMLAIFSEFLFGLSQPLYENLRKVTSLGFDDFLPNPFQFIYHQSFTI